MKKILSAIGRFPLKAGLLSSIIFLSEISFSQNGDVKPCATTEAEQKFRNEHPELIPQMDAEREALEQFTKEFEKKEKLQHTLKTPGQVYVIPVVFHILHDYGSENISDAQVYEAIQILNRDFRKLNSDTSQIIDTFKTIIADCEIEFRLAQKDPQGNCTNGIDRIRTLETYNGDDDSKLNQWPRNKYLNIWVARNTIEGAAAYAYLPASVNLSSWAWKDGIMCKYSYVGNGFRTLTHEVGHYFNLNHTWGNSNEPGIASNCNGDDGVSDTPNTIGQLGGCNTSVTTCNSLDNVQNYMNYSACDRMFTQGQATRMRAALTSSTAQRNNLWTASNLSATGVNVPNYICAADFSTQNVTVCVGNSIQFNDGSYNATPVSWQWTFDGATPATSGIQNPTVIYNTPGIYSVSLTVGNGTTTFSKTKSSYITVLPNPGKPKPFYEGFETVTIPGSDWVILNPDNSAFKWQLSTNASYSGNNCIKMNNFGNTALEKDELISNTIDLSGATTDTIKFKVAYCQKSSTTNDKLTLLVSTNCGTSWSPRFAKSGSALATVPLKSTEFAPSSTADWIEHAVPLISSNMVSNFQMKFVFESASGNNLYLDDIMIGEQTAKVNGLIIQNQEFIIYPNPANENFFIEFSLNEEEKITVEIYDVVGKKINTVANKNFSAGKHQMQFGSAHFETGIYFIKINTGSNSVVKKIVINH